MTFRDSRLTPDVDVSASWMIYAFYCLGFVLAGGGFVLYTGVDPRLPREAAAGSMTSQLLLGIVYLTATVLLLGNAEMRKVVVRAWPILLLPALALLSVLWSPDPALTLRRAIAFSGTLLFGLSFGAAFRFRDALSLICFSLALVMVVSIALAFLDPVHAIHQPDDAIQAVHAGSWRGIFAHRNTLGFWSGASLLTIALAGRQLFANRMIWLLALLAAAVCLIATGSSAGIAIVVLGAAFYLVLMTTLRQPPPLQGVLALFWLLCGLAVFLSFDEIARVSLWLLGRDSDLSGRTELWSYIVGLVGAADKPLGLGYFVGTLLLDQRLSAAVQMRNVNAHNGFLEAYVYFGWPGFFLSIGVALWIMWRAVRLAMKAVAGSGHLALIPAVFVFTALTHNLVESTIVSPNNLNNVLLSIAAAMTARARLEEKG